MGLRHPKITLFVWQQAVSKGRRKRLCFWLICALSVSGQAAATLVGGLIHKHQRNGIPRRRVGGHNTLRHCGHRDVNTLHGLQGLSAGGGRATPVNGYKSPIPSLSDVIPATSNFTRSMRTRSSDIMSASKVRSHSLPKSGWNNDFLLPSVGACA